MAGGEELEGSGGWTRRPGLQGKGDVCPKEVGTYVLGAVGRMSPQGCRLWLRGVAKFSLK